MRRRGHGQRHHHRKALGTTVLKVLIAVVAALVILRVGIAMLRAGMGNRRTWIVAALATLAICAVGGWLERQPLQAWFYLRGLAEGITSGTDNFTSFPESFLFLGQGYFAGGVPAQLPLFAAVAVGFGLLRPVQDLAHLGNDLALDHLRAPGLADDVAVVRREQFHRGVVQAVEVVDEPVGGQRGAGPAW